MKILTKKTFLIFAYGAVTMPFACAQGTADGYANFIRQVQLPWLPDQIKRDVYVDAKSPSEGQASPLEINTIGARFELHTVKEETLTSYLLDTKYVGVFIPTAQVSIRSQDPYELIPRTRADIPFYVEVTVNGLRNGASDPEPSKKVILLRHVQSYGTGDGTNIDRTQATLKSQSFITTNGDITLPYDISSIPSADLTKIRGEERFSIFSVKDYQADESQLASMFVQVWPMADGTISGITAGQTINFSTPAVTLAINDIYPDSQVYAQVYPGSFSPGTTGSILPGSAVIIKETVPQNRLLSVTDWGHVITANGPWTIEIVTVTPFGTEVLAHLPFNVDRTITVNGSVTTIE